MLIVLEELYNKGADALSASTLGLTRTDLQTCISDFANLGNAVPTDTDDLARVNRALDSALRQFYWPQGVGGPSVHEWSFMRPTRVLTTVANQGEYQLPLDFGGIEGELTYGPGQSYGVIYVRGEAFIRKHWQSNTVPGAPQYAAVRALLSDGSGLQRSVLMLAPIPNDAHELTYRYNVHPNALTAANPYPLGGAEHAETLLQSCRAAADRVFNDNTGDEYKLFIERLKASIAMDAQTKSPERLGYAYDPRMLAERYLPRANSGILPDVWVNGVQVQ